MPWWRKAMLGPATTATCQSCGCRVSVHWTAIWTTIPFPIAMGIALLVYSVVLATLIWIGGAVVMAQLYHFYVPLIARK